MRGRKTTASASKTKISVSSRPSKSSRSAKSNRSAASRKGGSSERLQIALKKANETRRVLQKKLSDLSAEMKNRLRQVEHDVAEKARLAFERDFARKEEARQKVIEAAISKFERDFSKKQTRKSTSRRSTKSGSRVKVVRSNSASKNRVSASR